ncbi:MAG: DUF6242 domain-containing protein [Lachnospiraceae bacterium]|nr:DUF6242 domain-containing protein [Lachnospiraceae bacterium]
MRIKSGGYLLAAAMLAMGVTACNSDSDETVDTGFTSDNIYSATAVTAFYIKANAKVLNNLDSCYFTIDLLQSKIFNADSLPYGTNVTKLVPNISTNGSSLIEISVSGSSVMNDTTFTYTTESTDSIDFSEPSKVRVRVVSVNSSYSQTYDINVNVHKVKADSLEWGTIAWKEIPGTPDAQKTIEFGDKIITLFHNGNGYHTWTATDPESTGTITPVSFPSQPELSSFTATDDALYCLGSNGALMTSADGTSWTATGETWSHIYGGYGTTLLGLEKSGSEYYHVSYPGNATRVKAAADCPVSGTSQFILIENMWFEKPIALTVGGRVSNGNLTGATWGYDGNTWAKLSEGPISTQYEDMSVFPYFALRSTGKWWRVSKNSALLAMGGRKNDGTVSDTVYVSFDGGIHWNKAGESLQLPDAMPPFANAQAIVKDNTLTSRAAAGNIDWNELPMLRRNPFGRAATPITSWECPFIYLYGGVDDSGSLYPTVWRGAINQLTFKPIE